jgi:8-oxo-dGTP diphosphatase
MKEVSAAIIIEHGKVLLARRAKGEKLAGYWEFPGGKREEDETIDECLVREIREELSLDIEVVGEFDTSDYEYPGGQIRLIGLLAEIQNGVISKTVHDLVEWIEISSVLDYQLAPADIPLAVRLRNDYG